MHEEMIAYMRDHAPVSSLELAKEFLKFKNPEEKIAHLAIRAILSKDRRCYFGEDNLWHAMAPPVADIRRKKLSDIPWAAVYLLVLPTDPKRVVHVSMWSVEEAPELLFNLWLENPDTLPYEEQEILRSVHDSRFEHEAGDEKLACIVRACEKRMPVFLSWHQHALFAQRALEEGLSLPDDAVLIGTLFACAKLAMPRPLSLDACFRALFGTSPVVSYAYKHGECLAQCCRELFDLLYEKGIVDLYDLEASEQSELAGVDFSGKDFAYEDIVNAPSAPGVYGFKNKDNTYIYIGKASNLKRRLMSYFRDSEESPDKLARLRSESQHLVTHECGSELESLIYEYRLIQKHSPLLNRQVTIGERKGAFQPLDDCVVLLPHAEADMGMSFWFRKGQKIQLRPFYSDFRDGPALVSELDKFFFGGTLPPAPSDFPEQEIATRWVKQRQDILCMVLVSRSASGREVFEMMRSYWKDVINK